MTPAAGHEATSVTHDDFAEVLRRLRSGSIAQPSYA